MYHNALTIVLLTCGRPNMIYLNVERMKYFPCRILIMDGSATPADSRLFPQHIKYYHVPDSNFVTRMRVGIESVKTPYFAFAAERHMVAWSSYKKSLEFLQNNHDYSCAHGKMVCAPELDTVQPLYVFTRGLDGYRQDSVLERLTASCEKYQPLFYGVTRTEIFKNFNLPPQIQSVAEWYMQYTFLMHGKVAILPHLYACILASPPYAPDYAYKNGIVPPLLFQALHRVLLSDFASSIHCEEDTASTYLHDILLLDLRLKFVYQHNIRKHEKTISLEDFLATCDSDAPKVILDILKFCEKNFNLYKKARETTFPYAPNSTEGQEQVLYETLAKDPSTFEFQSAWFEGRKELSRIIAQAGE